MFAGASKFGFGKDLALSSAELSRTFFRISGIFGWFQRLEHEHFLSKQRCYREVRSSIFQSSKTVGYSSYDFSKVEIRYYTIPVQ